MTNYGQSALLVDDDPERGAKVLAAFPMLTWVKTAADAISALKSREYATLFLDFDLTSKEKGEDFGDPLSGMEVVRFLKSEKPKVDEVVIISHNQQAAAHMMIELKSAGYEAKYEPFGRTRFWQEKLR
jgi:DNA-binding NarL/FixJ family response regulator